MHASLISYVFPPLSCARFVMESTTGSSSASVSNTSPALPVTQSPQPPSTATNDPVAGALVPRNEVDETSCRSMRIWMIWRRTCWRIWMNDLLIAKVNDLLDS